MAKKIIPFRPATCCQRDDENEICGREALLRSPEGPICRECAELKLKRLYAIEQTHDEYKKA